MSEPKFKVGQKVQIRTSKESWENLKKDTEQWYLHIDSVVDTAKKQSKIFKAPLVIDEISRGLVFFISAEEKRGQAHQNWIVPYQAKEEEPNGYHVNEDGFLTNEDNWKPGALGVL